MRYTTLIFDLDHTIFDFDASVDAAFAATLARAGVTAPNGHRSAFDEINIALWKRVERGELTPDQVGIGRFEELVERFGLDADPAELAGDYITALGEHGELLPGARDLLETLVPHASLALVSNGIGTVARAKIRRLDLERYFDAIVISGEVGVAKPHAGIFDLAFAELGHPDRAAVLMIGDSLTSDIAGGAGYGIDTCWYAPGEAGDLPPQVTYRITTLEELPPIVAAP